jgi:hypothetical protein
VEEVLAASLPPFLGLRSRQLVLSMEENAFQPVPCFTFDVFQYLLTSQMVSILAAWWSLELQLPVPHKMRHFHRYVHLPGLLLLLTILDMRGHLAFFDSLPRLRSPSR